MAHSTSTVLQDEISSISEELGFLPRHRLKSLITKPNVEAILKSANPETHKAPTWTDDRVCELASFVVNQDADKIFAILLMERKSHRIEAFFENKSNNDILPISAANGHPLEVQSKNKHTGMHEDTLKKISFLNAWEVNEIRGFIYRQWTFLSPIIKQQRKSQSMLETNFDPDFMIKFDPEFTIKFDPKFMIKFDPEFVTEFDSGIKLPWTTCHVPVEATEGVYAEVEKIAVPKSHFEYSWGQPPLLDHGDNQYLIAAKKLTGVNREKNANKEVTALKLLRHITSEHVIKAILYFKQPIEHRSAVNHWFIFPWADNGNLWIYWLRGSELEKPKLTIDFLVWTFGQLSGLIDAIRMMHDCGLRHGDLKPENILCFTDNTQPGDIPVRLVITDVGLSKAHEKSTSQRKDVVRDVTSTTVSTTRYQPPELNLQLDERVLSRDFDIWSSGCIFTEFLVWMLYGKEELVAFTDKKTLVEYWEKDDKGTRVLEVVREKLHAMTEDKDCISHPALMQLVDLIRNNFLIIEVETLVDKTGKNASSRPSLTGNKSFVLNKWRDIAGVFTKKKHGSGSNTTQERVSSSASTSRYRDTSEKAAASIKAINTEILGR